jgi:cytochrome c556
VKTILLAASLAAAALPAAALAETTTDPIETRQILMRANGHAGSIGGQVMRGELDYQPVIGRSVISSMHAAAQAFGDFFPEGSYDPDRSDAAPEIWENMDDFMELLDAFRTAAAQAAEQSGAEGPADVESFRAALQPVLGTCRDCHEVYRLDQ